MTTLKLVLAAAVVSAIVGAVAFEVGRRVGHEEVLERTEKTEEVIWV